VNPCLIVLDVNLPDISGPDVCRQLKRDPGTARIPVIQVTGAWLSEKARQEGLASGAQRYLVEPVDTATLLREVAAVLEESRQHASRSSRLPMIAVRGPGPCLTSIGVKTTESSSASSGLFARSQVFSRTCEAS
jgi:DNA-binding response OmpR family regulator